MPHLPGPGAPQPAPVTDIVALDALALSAAIRRREVSCVEVMHAYLGHIDRINPQANAIVGLQDHERSLAAARERDEQLARGEYLGWMHGFPHAVKDLAAAQGLPMTYGSRIHRDDVAPADEVFVSRIRRAGAVVIGKTNAPEFGLGSQTWNHVWGTTANAYDLSRTAGGSSGGAGAAVALRMLPVADGSDFMGSLRNPAAFNNVLGFRPSWGRVPDPGFVATPAVDGPMARTVADLAALLSTMAGPDAGAPLSLDADPAAFTADLRRDWRGTRIAWTGDWNGHLATEPGLLELCESSFAAFASLGCTVEPALPAYAPDKIWDTFMTWRWWSNAGRRHDLYRDPARRELLKPEMVWEIENGLRLSGLDVFRAVTARADLYAAVQALFEQYDFILAPSAQVFPFDKSVHWPREIDGRPMDTYHRWMETTACWSLTGLPALGMPAGFNDQGLPTGVQLIGRHHADLAVLQLGHAYEQATGWVAATPPPLLSAA